MEYKWGDGIYMTLASQTPVRCALNQDAKGLLNKDLIFDKSFHMRVANLSFTALIICVLISCRSYKMLDGKSHATYFSPDTSVFNDPDFPDPQLLYDDLKNISAHSMNTVLLRKGQTATAILANPTFFQAYDQFLVYPGEHIIIKKAADNDYTFMKTNGTKQRNRELLFFKMFSENSKNDFFINVGHASFDTILHLESLLKKSIPQQETASRLLFDSLSQALNVSRKFKRLTRGYTENTGWIMLYSFYEHYKDTLLAHGIYQNKNKQLVSESFPILRKTQTCNHLNLLNQMAENLIPHKIKSMVSQDDFSANFDSISTIFTGFARDYLLSQLIYFAYTKRLDIPGVYFEKYAATTKDNDLKKILYNVRSQQGITNANSTRIKDNGLLEITGSKVASLETILTKYKGRVLLLDFWASWCVLCREDIPFMDSLRQQFQKKDVIFLKISFDKEIQKWQKAIIATGEDTHNNYLLVNSEKSDFVKKYDVHTIPRYMLIDRSGKIVNTNAPRPNNPQLRSTLQSLVNK